MRAPIRIGTSGWEYPHWIGSFYPRDLARDRRLEFYADRFDTVELNNSFYRLPDAEVFSRWAERVPQRFAFAVKASRYLTHLRRLREPDEPLRRLWSRADRLGNHLGPMLYQLPPRWHLCRKAVHKQSRSGTAAGTDLGWWECWPMPASRCAFTICPSQARRRNRLARSSMSASTGRVNDTVAPTAHSGSPPGQVAWRRGRSRAYRCGHISTTTSAAMQSEMPNACAPSSNGAG